MPDPADLGVLAEQINSMHRASLASTQSSLEHARDCGHLLIAARAAVRHGQWLAWLKANVDCSARTAQNYIKVAEQWDSLVLENETVSYLTLKAAVKLLTLPKPSPYISVEEFESEHNQGLRQFSKTLLECDPRWQARHTRLQQFEPEARDLMEKSDKLRKQADRAQAKVNRLRAEMTRDLEAEFARQENAERESPALAVISA